MIRQLLQPQSLSFELACPKWPELVFLQCVCDDIQECFPSQATSSTKLSKKKQQQQQHNKTATNAELSLTFSVFPSGHPLAILVVFGLLVCLDFASISIFGAVGVPFRPEQVLVPVAIRPS